MEPSRPGAETAEVPRFSILITSYRSLRFLEECLGSLRDLRGPSYEVLFLDNGSPEPEAGWVRAHVRDPRFRVFEVPETRYFAGGVNYLAQRARGEYLALLNSDAKADPDWLAVLDARLRETGYEALSSDVREASRPDVQQNDRWCLDPFGLTHQIPEDAAARGPIFRADGCGMVIRRGVFVEAGALDEDFKMYFEEVDLCWRLNLLDYRIGYAPGAILHHVGQGSSVGTFFLWNRFRGRRNRIWSYAKNAGPLLLAFFLPAHFLVCLGGIAVNLLRGRPGNAVAEAAAVAAAFANLGIPLSKRGAIQRARRVSDAEFVRRGFIVLRVKLPRG